MKGSILTVGAEDTSLRTEDVPQSDQAFQGLLLRLAEAASEGTPAPALIAAFCRDARRFFGVDGVYFWRHLGTDELLGAQADGIMADSFAGRRLRADQSSVAVEAIRQRKTLYSNQLDIGRYAIAAEFRAKSLMGAPLIVANEAIGALVFLHASQADFFNEELSVKATILAGQLGSLLEARRLMELAQKEQLRAGLLAEVVQSLPGSSDVSTVAEALADRLRALLRTPVVCVLMREAAGFTLLAVAAESAQLATSIRSRHDRKGMQFAADLASRAIAAGEPITIAIDPSRVFGELIRSGALIAAPFRTSQSQGAILIYPREEAFSSEDRSLVLAVAGFGAVAIANAELYAKAQAQANELHQILAIASELGSIRHLDQFMNRFVLRAADFLGFNRAFLGLLEAETFHVRWGSDNGKAAPIELVFPEGVAARTLLGKEVYWADDPAQVPGANLSLIAKFEIHQILAVPLLGTERQVLGVLGLLDRADKGGISQQDVRRAQALASQVAIALEVTRNLQVSELHRGRAESLMQLALELNSSLGVSDFAKSFVKRAMETMGAKAGALLVKQEDQLETLVLRGENSAPIDRLLWRRFDRNIARALSQNSEEILCSTASDLFGPDFATELEWNDCCLVRLLGRDGELVGVLALANRGKLITAEDRWLLQAVAGHASVALENARLFTRMEQANRHWTEIFDAITDFIVAHDYSDNVLRVNRSLASFIGVSPRELVGLHMWALFAMGGNARPASCPFCRLEEQGMSEYVHPVLERTYIVSTSRVHGASGEGLQVIHVLKDITDRREAERRYRELFDNIQEGLFFCTPDGRFVEVNDALVRMLGYSGREELLQADIPTQVYGTPEQHQALVLQMEREGVVRNREEMLKRRDGSAVYVLINAFAVKDAQDRVQQYRGLILDITGLKSFQTELQRERDFSGKILNHTQSLILVADTSGSVSYANRRWFDLGYEHSRLVGRPLEELVSPARRDAWSQALSLTLAGNQVDNLELQIVRGGGRVGHFSVNLSPMRDEQGSVTSIIVVMTDVTDAALLQAKLLHAEKMVAVGQLVSGVAHEVNNPLTAILGFADLMMENPDLPESARGDLRFILQEAKRTKQIVQNLLSFARQTPPQRKPVQVNTILLHTLQLRAYDFHSRGVEIVERLSPDLPHVIGDAHQLQQVFLNILNNAYDAVREIGPAARIEIATATQGSHVLITFRDNGPGISQPDRIFDPFFTTKEVGKGTGLGLSICYGIVHEHGGEILCHNNLDGEGATFKVRFPIAFDIISSGASAGVTQP